MGNNVSQQNVINCLDIDILSKETESLSTSSIITLSSPSSSLTSSPISNDKISYFSNDNDDNNNGLDYRNDNNDVKSSSSDDDDDDDNNNNIGCIGSYFFSRKYNNNNLIVVDKNVETTLSNLKKQQKQYKYINSFQTKRKEKSKNNKYVTIIEEIKKISRPKIFSSSNNSKIFIFTCEASILPLSSKIINSLLRAIYLNKITNKEVVVVLPWLENKYDQIIVYGKVMFDSISQYKEYMQNWILSEVKFLSEYNSNESTKVSSFPIQFECYPAKYHVDSNSIYAVNDIFQPISSSSPTLNDICILEEPEHLNWYRSPNQICWTERFLYVIGIIHTNYKEYANECNNNDDNDSMYSSSSFIPAISSYYSSQTCCHTVITSPTTIDDNDDNNRDIVACNIQGVPRSLFNFKETENSSSSCNIYCQMDIINNNYNSIIKLQNAFYKRTGRYFPIDMYCDNNDTTNNIIKDRGLKYLNNNKKDKLPIHINEDTATISSSQTIINGNYKICINPDKITNYSNITMNAVALNQFVIVPIQNVCNAYFKETLYTQNILVYNNEKEFCNHLLYAMKHDPFDNDDDDLKYELSWTAATERLIDLFS